MKRVSSAPVSNTFDPGSSGPAGTPADRAGGSRTSNNPFLRSRRESTAGAQSSTVPVYREAATQTQAATPTVPSPTASTSAAQSVDGRSDASSVAEAVTVLNRLRQNFPALLAQASEATHLHIHPVDSVRMYMEHALDEASGQLDRLLQQQGLRADLRAPMLAGLRQEIHQAFDQAARTFNDGWYGEVETHSGAHTDTEAEPLLGHREASRAAPTRAASPLSSISAGPAAPSAEGRSPSEANAPPAGVDPLTQRLRDRGVDARRASQLASGLQEMAALQRRDTAPAVLQTSGAALPAAPTLSRAHTLDPGSLEEALAARGGMSPERARETAEAFRAMIARAHPTERDQ